MRPVRSTVRVAGVERWTIGMGMGMSKGVRGQVVRVVVEVLVEIFWSASSGWDAAEMDRSREESEVESDRGDARGMQTLIWTRLEAMEIGTHEGTFVGRNIVRVEKIGFQGLNQAREFLRRHEAHEI